ncbi:MAG TPA: hypothetical protein VHN16_10890 [Streptosporangiaceae bacterium]|nr:hypothetical protein [Streptosporangiaceae bacterium]
MELVRKIRAFPANLPVGAARAPEPPICIGERGEDLPGRLPGRSADLEDGGGVDHSPFAATSIQILRIREGQIVLFRDFADSRVLDDVITGPGPEADAAGNAQGGAGREAG